LEINVINNIDATEKPFPYTCLEINGLTRDNVERVCACLSDSSKSKAPTG
jgi:hypothetical protein